MVNDTNETPGCHTRHLAGSNVISEKHTKPRNTGGFYSLATLSNPFEPFRTTVMSPTNLKVEGVETNSEEVFLIAR